MAILMRTPLFTTVQNSLSKSAIFGSCHQIRNHVKIYPIHYNKNRRECYLDPTVTPYTDRSNLAEFQGVGEKRVKMRKPWMNVTPKENECEYNKYHWDDSYSSDPAVARETAISKLNRFKDSVISRGNARESQPYNPPQDVKEKIYAIFTILLEESGAKTSQQSIDIDPKLINLNEKTNLKFSLASRCVQEFGHDLQNSSLSYITTLADLIEYYSTPVRGINSYDALLRKANELPKNLHILAEPIRYDMENDSFFGGYTAYPGIVSKVNGLRASKKYPILNQEEFQWPDI